MSVSLPDYPNRHTKSQWIFIKREDSYQQQLLKSWPNVTALRPWPAKVLNNKEDRMRGINKKNFKGYNWLVLKGLGGVPPVDDLQLLWAQAPDTGPLSLIVLRVHVGPQPNRYANSGGPPGSSRSFIHSNTLCHIWDHTTHDQILPDIHREINAVSI